MDSKEIYDIINLGMTIDFDGDSGMICHKAIKDNAVYVNIAFDEEDGNINYKVFKIEYIDEKVKFKEVYDEGLKSELTSYWIAEDVEEAKNP